MNDQIPFLPKVTFVKAEKILNQEDTSFPELETEIFQTETTEEPGIIFSDQYGPLIERVKLNIKDTDKLLDLMKKSEERIKQLDDKYYEIWHKTHNVNDINEGGIHLPDPYGEPSELIDFMKNELLKTGYKVVDPKYNHNKVSSRKWDKFGLNENHIDSFEGYRLDEEGNRFKVWRYLINMRETPRTTSFCPYGRDLIDLIPKEYSTDMLDAFFEKLDKKLKHYLLTMPPANYKTGEFYGIKILVTNILHAEYGQKDDLLITINSLE